MMLLLFMSRTGWQSAPVCRLVDTLEWRNSLALVLVEGSIDDVSVLDLDLWLGWVSLPGESMLHPVFVVTLRKGV